MLDPIEIGQVKRLLTKKAPDIIKAAMVSKNNMTATAPPTINDDVSVGYAAGSIWLYNSVAYACVDATDGAAVWISTNDTFYFDTWSALIAAISVAGTQYVGKYCSVANANNGPSGGVTYTSGTSLTDIIVDGGSATYKVNIQGANYSVTCQPRTITNPIITLIMVTAAAKPTVKGYYIFTVTPTNGLPAGINLNDIAYYDGSTWALYQSYSKASTVLVSNDVAGTTQVTWRKFAGTWMSTAEEYIPDGKEYQTGKLWSGKPVYRKCIQGTLPSSTGSPSSTGMTIPSTGTLILCSGTGKRNTSPAVRFSIGQPGTAVELYEDLSDYTIKAWLPTSAGAFCSQPYVAWVEYTKV